MFILDNLSGWTCNDVINTFHLVKQILNAIRIIVPIVLIVMTTVDITKKVINPEDKDGQKKIMLRAIAALIVFLVPTIVSLTFRVIDWGNGKPLDPRELNQTLSSCWDRA